MTYRRRELGLSREEVARRAGMAPQYLAYLESHPEAAPSTAAMLRLAAALETTAGVLEGGGQERPAGGGPPGPRPVLGELTTEECEALLGPGGVGRLVSVTEQGPTALPVNYGVLGGDVVFRTGDGVARQVARRGETVGFEVDHLDEAMGEGWSVLVNGRARVEADPAERRRIDELGVTPWAGGERETYVRVSPTAMSGRRIRVRR